VGTWDIAWHVPGPRKVSQPPARLATPTLGIGHLATCLKFARQVRAPSRITPAPPHHPPSGGFAHQRVGSPTREWVRHPHSRVLTHTLVGWPTRGWQRGRGTGMTASALSRSVGLGRMVASVAGQGRLTDRRVKEVRRGQGLYRRRKGHPRSHTCPTRCTVTPRISTVASPAANRRSYVTNSRRRTLGGLEQLVDQVRGQSENVQLGRCEPLCHRSGEPVVRLADVFDQHLRAALGEVDGLAAAVPAVR